MDQILLEKVQKNLKTLLLKDMAESLEASLHHAVQERQAHLEFISQLLDAQMTGRRQRTVQRRIDRACFPRHMTFENFDWGFQPGLNVEHLKNLKQLAFVRDKSPLLMLGTTGCGKTHIATALGLKACELGFKARFARLQEILAQLYASLADDSTDELLIKLSKLDLLILDDVNYVRARHEYPSLLLDLVNACQDRVCLIVTTQLSIEDWGKALGNPSVVNAVVDRLFHRAEILHIHPAISYRTHGPHAPKIPTKTE
jgi:DNA replication protein DnaC